jgi:6-phosphogluconate dehydrogenase
MQIGLVGLGKMGMNMLKRLVQGGHQVVAYDIHATTREEAVQAGAQVVSGLNEMCASLVPPRTIWVMVPAGDATSETIQTLATNLTAKDVLIDGGNSNYKDSQRRAKELQERGIHLLDAGTSGGIWGLENGYCLMVGGDSSAYAQALPAFTTLAPKDGLLHVGPSGAGHFVKMVHNGIEYAMMQAYAEGFELLQAKSDLNLDLQGIAGLWNHGSVVRSWLLELLDAALQKDPGLDGLKAYVEDSGEGRWTVEAAIEARVPAPTISMALFERFRSRQDNSFANRLLAALRNEFGGHSVKKG